MIFRPVDPKRLVLVVVTAVVCVMSAFAQASKPKKVFMVTDMEGVDGIFDSDLQCIPYKSLRWQESHKLLAQEVNAGVEGLLAGGATQVVVLDSHDGARSLSVLDIPPKALLLTGEPMSPAFELDSSYSALVFIGQHAMAGAQDGILGHSFSSLGIQNFWVNGKPTGEIGGMVMLAGYFGVPAIMLSGDEAACEEFHDLVPQAECAVVKWGVSRTAGFMLPHSVACALIRQKTQRAMERLADFKPYRLSGPVEIKVEFTTRGEQTVRLGNGVERLNERTWVFRGKDFLDAWRKWRK